MAPEIMVPQSVGVTLFAFGVVVGAALFGGVAWLWSGARSGEAAYRRGYLQGYDSGHDSGFIHGFREAGVLDRLVTLDEATSTSCRGLQADAEFRQAANERRHRAALAAWNAEGRRWA